MTAQEAREMTVINRRGIDHIYTSVRAMAQSGEKYAAFEPTSFTDVQAIKEQLEKDGYVVELTETCMYVRW